MTEICQRLHEAVGLRLGLLGASLLGRNAWDRRARRLASAMGGSFSRCARQRDASEGALPCMCGHGAGEDARFAAARLSYSRKRAQQHAQEEVKLLLPSRLLPLLSIIRVVKLISPAGAHFCCLCKGHGLSGIWIAIVCNSVPILTTAPSANMGMNSNGVLGFLYDEHCTVSGKIAAYCTCMAYVGENAQ